MGATASSSKESSLLQSEPLLEDDDKLTNSNAPPKITRANKLYAFCAALNSCNLGYDIGVNTGAGMLVQNSLVLSDVQLEVFMGSLNLFAMVGALCSHIINDKFGRRWSFRVSAIIFIIGTILQSVTHDYVVLMIGRAFVGLGVGFGLAVDPVYISEISPAAHRGQLVNMSEFAINLGIVFGFASGLIFASVDEDVAWRWMFSLGAILPCFVIYFATFVMPESPRWLVANGRGEDAREVLKKVYPDGYDVGVIVTEIKDSIEKERIAEHAVGWGVILFPSPAFKRILLVGIGISVAQQAVGIDAIIYFMVFILNKSGIHSRITQMWILLGLGLIKLGVIFIAGLLLDRTGRRPLVFISLLGMAVSFFIVAMSFVGVVASEVAAIVGLALYLAFFSIGMGPATWTVASEVFTTSIRAKAMSVATFSNRATATIFASSFLSVANAMTWSGFFIMMTVVCLIIFVWMYIYLPETKGRPLEEMAQYFAEITGDQSILRAEETLNRRDGDRTDEPEQEVLL
jgi:sugar porter (SP) family MFS transporter